MSESPSPEALEQRLVELEIRVAYQDDTLTALNDTVAEQAETLAALRTALGEALRRVEVLEPDKPEPDETPPHY